MLHAVALLSALLWQQGPAYDVVIRGGPVLEPFQYSVGNSHVMVNGACVVDEGQPTAAKPGPALTRQRTARRS